MNKFFVKMLLQYISKLLETVTQASCLRSQARGLCYGCLFIFFSVSSVQSQQREQLFPGARPFGLGEAFVAIADDGNAIYWNPAGLPYLKREEVNFMYSDLYGININNFYVSYARPIIKKLAFGIDWLNYGYDDEELSFGRNYWNLSSGYAFNNYLAVGGNFKYVRTNTQLKGSSDWNANGSGWGMDFGILFNYQFKNLKFLKEFRAGFMLHDAFETHLRFNGGEKEKIHSRSPQFGFCYKPFDVVSWKGLRLYDPIIAMDFDDRFHLGSEVWFLKDILPSALRGGVQKDFYNDEGLTWSAGFSIQKDMFRIDYAYTIPPTLPSTHRFSVAIIYHFNPRLVEVTRAYVEPVFSSLIRQYDKPDKFIGKAWLKNKHDQPLEDVMVSFKAKDLAQDTCWQGRLDSSAVVDLRANFNYDILKIDETEKGVDGEIEVAYKVKDRSYEEKVPVRFFLYGNRAIRWDEPGRAVAFITPDDSLVRSFAISVNREYKIDLADWLLKTEIADAVKIYEALRLFGVMPTPDASASFSAATAEGYPIDTITWPATILSGEKIERKGDCEDLAILYASLLESIGIQTALLKTTGHIFIMFNTGIPIAQRFSLPIEDRLLVKEKGYLWLPIETTAIESPFVKAWDIGASKYQAAFEEKDLQVLFVMEERRNFPSVTHAPVKHRWWDFPDSIRVQRLMYTDLLQAETWKSEFIRKNYLSILNTNPDSVSVRNQLGCIYAGQSKFDEARREFQAALKHDPVYSPSLNNLGNLYFMEGDLINARQYYEKCLATQKYKSGTYLNLAILYQMMSQLKEFSYDSQNLHNKSHEMLERVVDLVGEDSTAVLSLLGIGSEDIHDYLTAKEKKEKSWFEERIEEVKIFINKSLAALVQKRHPKDKRPKLKSAGPTGSEADENRRFILYWDFEGI